MSISILSEWLEEAERKKRENEKLSKKEKKLLFYSRNNIDPKFPHNGWIDPKGKLYPLAYGMHIDFSNDWIEKNTLGLSIISHELFRGDLRFCYSYQLLEFLGWVKIHDSQIMCKKVKYKDGVWSYETCDHGLELSIKTRETIRKLLAHNAILRKKKYREFTIYE